MAGDFVTLFFFTGALLAVLTAGLSAGLTVAGLLLAAFAVLACSSIPVVKALGSTVALMIAIALFLVEWEARRAATRAARIGVATG